MTFLNSHDESHAVVGTVNQNFCARSTPDNASSLPPRRSHTLSPCALSCCACGVLRHTKVKRSVSSSELGNSCIEKTTYPIKCKRYRHKQYREKPQQGTSPVDSQSIVQCRCKQRKCGPRAEPDESIAGHHRSHLCWVSIRKIIQHGVLKLGQLSVSSR